MSQKKKSSQVDVLIIGAGFAGVSTAYHLSKSPNHKIAVVEHDAKIGGHASGRNAGMIRQAIADPIIAKLACEGRRALIEAPRKGFLGLRLRPNGSLLLSKKSGFKELGRIAQALKRERVSFQWFDKKKAEDLVKLLKSGDFDKGLFCPTDSLIDIHGLMRAFLEQLERNSVPVYLGHPVRSIQKKGDWFEVSAGRRLFRARSIVNAAGAWASIVGIKAKAMKIPLAAYRRHLFYSRRFKGLRSRWPFVWDVSHDFYFRPYGKDLMLSACDKVKIIDLRKALEIEKIDWGTRDTLLRKLYLFSARFRSLKVHSAKSGLRTMTPDGRFIIGEDPRLRGFYWVAGLGGHGVTTSFAVGKMAAGLILGERVDPVLKRALGPERFFKAPRSRNGQR